MDALHLRVQLGEVLAVPERLEQVALGTFLTMSHQLEDAVAFEQRFDLGQALLEAFLRARRAHDLLRDLSLTRQFAKGWGTGPPSEPGIVAARPGERMVVFTTWDGASPFRFATAGSRGARLAVL
jgi:hypothetical protein